jgi:hypothetical protein
MKERMALTIFALRGMSEFTGTIEKVTVELY